MSILFPGFECLQVTVLIQAHAESSLYHLLDTYRHISGVLTKLVKQITVICNWLIFIFNLWKQHPHLPEKGIHDQGIPSNAHGSDNQDKEGNSVVDVILHGHLTIESMFHVHFWEQTHAVRPNISTLHHRGSINKVNSRPESQ